MLFNSLEFLIFLIILFVLYWFVFNKHYKLQNILILVASYVFYGWWDWRFLTLICFSSLMDYIIGRALGKNENQLQRKLLLGLSIVVNIGLLGFFKYFNFFIDSFISMCSIINLNLDFRTLSIILPVGISFYTFQTLSYSIDIYRKKLEPTKDFVSFFAFVGFFPQLVAGPIERATNLLPQFSKERVFSKEDGTYGVRLIIYGLFKKIVIADNLALYVNEVYGNPAAFTGSSLVLATVFFAFQIYCDFSSYSDIAIGVARLFGFKIMTNFKTPYFSRDIAEFWRRWHISLSTWFRDYLYIPLGGSRGSKLNQIRNVFIIFIVSGFWHGANVTFILWGGLNALYFLPLLVMNKNRRFLDSVSSGRRWPGLKDFRQILTTFIIVCFAWIFFRAASVEESFQIISKIFSSSLFLAPKINVLLFILLLIFIVFDWQLRNMDFATWVGLKNRVSRWSIYFFIFLMCFFFANFNGQEFIYFQF